jgi:hypothetical protein
MGITKNDNLEFHQGRYGCGTDEVPVHYRLTSAYIGRREEVDRT